MLDRHEMAEGRFRELLMKWLGKLPPGGWEGTSHQLGDALAAFGDRHRLFAYVPDCLRRAVVGLGAFVSAHGFDLSACRTEHARSLRFTRSSGES